MSSGTRTFFALNAGQQLDDGLAHLVQFRTELLKHLGGYAFALTDQAEQDVLGADVVVAELQRFAERQLENLLRPGREGNVTAWSLRTLPDDLDDLGANRLETDPKALETARGYALALVDEAEQDVLGPYVIMVKQPGFFLGEYNDSPGPVGEPFKHSSPQNFDVRFSGRHAEYSFGRNVASGRRSRRRSLYIGHCFLCHK